MAGLSGKKDIQMIQSLSGLIKESSMRIIIEGADGVGKTTIAEKIAEKFNLSLVHFTNKDPRDLNFYYQSLRKNNVVYDRSFLSEMIYPKIFNRPQKLKKYEFEYLLEKAKELEIKIIILNNDNYGLKDSEDKVIKNNINKIKDDYLKLGGKYSIPIVKNEEELWKILR